ncbi:hypothetical protein [Acutalibacter sp. 1XD8-33]|nr:hypothetical protein [Acutalibacter sp. 1XD8-33]
MQEISGQKVQKNRFRTEKPADIDFPAGGFAVQFQKIGIFRFSKLI